MGDLASVAVALPLSLDPRLTRAVRKVFLRAVLGFYSSKPGEEGFEGGRSGAVCQLQRFGSALNANLHMHSLVLDGVYTAPDAHTAPTFHRARPISDTEVPKLLFTIRSRVLRSCRRRGLLLDEEELATEVEAPEQGLLPLLFAASIQGRVALGPEAGSRISRLDRPRWKWRSSALGRGEVATRPQSAWVGLKQVLEKI